MAVSNLRDYRKHGNLVCSALNFLYGLSNCSYMGGLLSREKLEALIRKEGLNAKILTFKEPTITVESAARQLGVNREKIIKTMLFVDEKGVPILAIVTGDRRVSETKLAVACNTQKVRIARPSSVKHLTGYEAGALPPIGHKRSIRTFIDPKVMSLNKVYGGGGEINALLEVSPQDIKRLTNAKVVDISEGNIL